jgi:hypothetical protein
VYFVRGVRRAQIEFVREAVVGRAVSFVAVAAAVAEDRETARVAALDVARGVGVRARVVEEDARLVGRPGVIDAVEDEIRAGDVLAVGGQIERLGAEAHHRLVSSSAEALATA